MRTKRFALLIVLALMLSACSGDLEVSKKTLEKQVTAKSTEKKLVPSSVKCATGLKGKVGAKATCTILANDLKYTANVKATKVKGKVVSFLMNVPGPAILPTKSLETQVTKIVGAQVESGIDTVTCPDELEGTVGQSVDCSILSNSGEKLNIGVTVSTADFFGVNFEINQK
jgi:hypothetical protein